jgi:hypothetical protein
MSERATEPAKLLDRSGITLRQGFSGLVSALRAVDLGGRAIIQGLVQPTMVVKGEIRRQWLSSFPWVRIVMQVYLLIFHGTP